MQLVPCVKLDARHPEWVSADFIKDSVTARALQDPSKYSGELLITRTGERRGGIKYSVEDDARMLHFGKLRGWRAMSLVPESAWRLAESARVTLHLAQSMHEPFTKKLQWRTLKEQRAIMAETAVMAHTRLLEEDEVEVLVLESPRLARARAITAGFRDAATPEPTTSRTLKPASSRNTTIPQLCTIETRLKEVEEKFSGQRRRSRKPTSPLRISQRLRQSEEAESASSANQGNDEEIASATPAGCSATASQTLTPTQVLLLYR